MTDTTDMRLAFVEIYKGGNMSELAFADFKAGWQAATERATPKWQPIQTAPKDGTEIVGAEWQQVEGYQPELETMNTNYDGGAWRYPSGETWTPTHWMPLPPPPAIRQGGDT